VAASSKGKAATSKWCSCASRLSSSKNSRCSDGCSSAVLGPGPRANQRELPDEPMGLTGALGSLYST
jgi:hypothetical protein